MNNRSAMPANPNFAPISEEEIALQVRQAGERTHMMARQHNERCALEAKHAAELRELAAAAAAATGGPSS